MRRFRFKFEPVLRYRRMMEEQRKLEFAQAMAVYDLALSRLNEVLKRMEDVKRELEHREEEGLTASEAQLYLRYLSLLKEIEAERREELRRAEEKMKTAREKLMESRRDKRAIEILREKEMERFNEEFKREELKLIDEVSINKMSRRGRSR